MHFKYHHHLRVLSFQSFHCTFFPFHTVILFHWLFTRGVYLFHFGKIKKCFLLSKSLKTVRMQLAIGRLLLHGAIVRTCVSSSWRTCRRSCWCRKSVVRCSTGCTDFAWRGSVAGRRWARHSRWPRAQWGTERWSWNEMTATWGTRRSRTGCTPLRPEWSAHTASRSTRRNPPNGSASTSLALYWYCCCCCYCCCWC